MNKKEKASILFGKMELIDDKYLAEAESYVPARAVMRRKLTVAFALAACMSLFIVLGIGSMLMRGVQSNKSDAPQYEPENAPVVITISSVLADNSLPSREVDVSSLDLFDGVPRIIWQDTESGEYYQAEISASEQSDLKIANLSAQNVSDTVSTYRIWFVSPTGEVTSPELKESAGNTSIGALFTYDPELELTDAFIEKLGTILN